MRSCAIFIFQYDYFKKSKKFVVDSKDVKKNLLFKLTFNQIQMNQLFHFTIQPNFVPFLVFIHLIQRFCSCNLSSVEENLCFTVKAQAIFSLCKHVSIGRLPINAFRITVYPQLKIRKTSFLRFVVECTLIYNIITTQRSGFVLIHFLYFL